jgi:lysophospholipase L1-like esterase
VFAEEISRWSAQDALGGWPEGPLVFVGSSTVRRWEGFAPAYADHAPLQRGFGGAQLGEVALYANELVVRHAPRGVVVFAGTNDIAAGVSPDIVVDRLRCLRARIAVGVGVATPVLYVAITPAPARWDTWAQASAVNTAVAALAEADPGLVYVDTATPFLATGSPPSAALFVEDGLHLSEEGYALWAATLRPAVDAVLAPRAPDAAAPLAAGTRVRVDLGPSDGDDGEATPAPDYLGNTWNNWFGRDGGADVLPGEQLIDLVDITGVPTPVDLVIAGGFYMNGRRNGGLLWPDTARLGDLAVGSATGDYFYTDGADMPGALFLRGLDPAARYTLRLFAAREETERRVTRYTVSGAAVAEATLQTSGASAGAADTPTNDDTVVTLTHLAPDAWGHLFLDVAAEEGPFGYLSLLELEVE